MREYQVLQTGGVESLAIKIKNHAAAGWRLHTVGKEGTAWYAWMEKAPDPLAELVELLRNTETRESLLRIAASLQSSTESA
jgi:hypothetical protein